MDAAVFSIGKGLWHVNTSPTMRDLGEIIRSADGTFTLVPDEGAALEGMAVGPYPSLDKARDAIAGTSRRQVQPRALQVVLLMPASLPAIYVESTEAAEATLPAVVQARHRQPAWWTCG
jgi:hypothetical protein